MDGNMIRGKYGELESNHWSREQQDRYLGSDVTVDLGDARLGRVVRLRLLSDPGFPFWDVSYCYGELKDGTPCRVQLDTSQFRKATLKREIIDMAKRAGVFAKGIGLLDDEVISKCL
jgi:hypothetical protein